MATEFDHLRRCSSLSALQIAVHAMCAPFGSVVRLDVLCAVQVGRQQALCFLRMGSIEQERQAQESLHLSRFGDRLVLVLDIDHRWQDEGVGPASRAIAI
ncbi:MAG: RNA-binding protein [Comamonadaceae bacterium]|nr:MAG: RNA-binding protein [Comamonadaceae bacterium]